MAKGLKLAEPPRRPSESIGVSSDDVANSERSPVADTGMKFNQVAPGETVQFNKRVKRSVADGYVLLSVSSRIKVPELLEEGLRLLEEKYGKV